MAADNVQTRAAYSGNIDPLAAKYCHVSVIIQDVDCFGRSLLIVQVPALNDTAPTPNSRMASAARRISGRVVYAESR